MMMSSSISTSGVEVLQIVIKEFLNEDRKSIEIALIRHVNFDCLEIVGFDSVLNQETNRLYVSLKKIRSKLSRKVVDEEASRIDNESGAPKTQSQKLNKAMTDLTIDFVLSRIVYRYNPLQPSFVLHLTSSPDDTSEDSDSMPAFQYERIPEGITPYQMIRNNNQSVKLNALDVLNLGAPTMAGSPGHPRKSSPTKIINVHQSAPQQQQQQVARSLSPSYSSGSGPADNSTSSTAHFQEQLLANDHSNLLRMDMWTSALPDDEEEEDNDPSGAATATGAASAGTGKKSPVNNGKNSSSSGSGGDAAKHSSLRRRSFEAAAQLAQRVLPSQLVPLVLGTRSLDQQAAPSESNHKAAAASPLKGGLDGNLPRLEPHGSGTSSAAKEAPKRRNTYSMVLPSRVEPEMLLHLPRTHRVAGSSSRRGSTGGGGSEVPNVRNRRTLDDDLAAHHSIKHQSQQQQQSEAGVGEGVSGMDSARRPEEQQQQQGGGGGVQPVEGIRRQAPHPHKKKLSYHLLKNYY